MVVIDSNVARHDSMGDMLNRHLGNRLSHSVVPPVEPPVSVSRRRNSCLRRHIRVHNYAPPYEERAYKLQFCACSSMHKMANIATASVRMRRASLSQSLLHVTPIKLISSS